MKPPPSANSNGRLHLRVAQAADKAGGLMHDSAVHDRHRFELGIDNQGHRVLLPQRFNTAVEGLTMLATM